MLVDGDRLLINFYFKRFARQLLLRLWDVFWGLIVFTLLVAWATDFVISGKVGRWS